jgi:translocator protein
MLRLGISLGICLFAGYIGSLYAIPLIPTWFASLAKPGFIPADLDIIPLGLIVYALFGLALDFIWHADPRNDKDKKTCLFLFFFSLLLSVAWVYVFFGLRSPLAGLMIMIMLFAVLLSTIFQALRVSIGASLLLVPDLALSVIIAYANYSILVANPHLPIFFA